ncbi:MAG: hypothetical protein GT598_11615 [Bacteroidales bacterium]|nr:hypothetical protein [Bacteroidales bacterium]
MRRITITSGETGGPVSPRLFSSAGAGLLIPGTPSRYIALWQRHAPKEHPSTGTFSE